MRIQPGLSKKYSVEQHVRRGRQKVVRIDGIAFQRSRQNVRQVEGNAAPSEQEQRNAAHTRSAGHHAEHAGPGAFDGEIDQQRPGVELHREGDSAEEAAQAVAIARKRVERKGK